MLSSDRDARGLALCLSALAGFVDAAGFLLTKGLFVSFMSGNSTRLAVGVISDGHVMVLAGGLIGMFMIGVVGGAVIAGAAPAPKSAVMAASTGLLILSASIASLGMLLGAAAILAAAMGALNNVFLKDGEVAIGVTYMTGTIVRAGQRIAGAITGDGPSDWLPHILLWLALIAGAVAGATIATRSAVLSLWIAAGCAALLALVAQRLDSSAG